MEPTGTDLNRPTDPQQVLYIKLRARGVTKTSASKRTGLSRNTATRWEDEDWFWPAIEAEQVRMLGDPTEMLGELVPKAWDVLRTRLNKGDLDAARDVLDRRYGKATQAIKHQGDPDAPLIVGVRVEDV